MKLMDENQLDEFQEEYDLNWVRNSILDKSDATELLSARERLLLFFKAKGVDPISAPELVESLCETELERDWMWWRKWLENRITKDDFNINLLMAEFQRNATVTDFADLFAESREDSKHRLAHLYRVELRSRANWGDYPRACWELKQRLPLPRQLEVYRNGSKQVVVSLHEKTEFGRQRSSEDSLGAHGYRAAISDRNDAYISRRQFEIQMLSPQFAVIQNLSPSVPLHWLGRSRVSYKQNVLLTFPAYLRVGDLELYIA